MLTLLKSKSFDGPGYRVYYHQGGKTIGLLCRGGDKRTQDADIRRAVEIAKNWKG
jgi:putative addiction module killer protein